MSTILMPSSGDRSYDKRLSSSWAKKSLFSKTKPSDDWHLQIDFTANDIRPSDKRFPWLLVKKHTDTYIKKKGKKTQADTDIRLSILIENHEARDIAVAACAHAMSPASVRALLNIELNVAPATFYGLETFLQSLIAANYCNPRSVSDLEAYWAARLLPYAIHGTGAAGRYLEGVCAVLASGKVPNMNMLPDISMLARRAFGDFASQLEGFKLRCQWVMAHAWSIWLSKLAANTPPVTPPGHLLPVHLLDVHFPIWRIWALWKPDLDNITLLNGLDSVKRSILPDMMALEGPDFITGSCTTMRDGIIAQYGAEKSLVRFRSLVIEVPTRSKEQLKDMLQRLAELMKRATKSSKAGFKFFAQLTITRPINQDALQLLEAISKVPDTTDFHIHSALLEIYLARPKIGGQHISALQHLICTLDDNRADPLRNFVLQPWLVQGIETCVLECQAAIRTHMETGLEWTHLLQEFHTFCKILKSSEHCFPLLDTALRAQFEVLPTKEQLGRIVEIYDVNGGSKVIASEVTALKDAIEAFCIDRFMERGTIGHASKRTVEAMLSFWATTKSDPRRKVAIIACKSAGMDFVQRCWILEHMGKLPDLFITNILAIMNEEKREKSIVELTTLLVNTDHPVVVGCFKAILYSMIENQSETLLDFTLKHFTVCQWSQWMLTLFTLFTDTINNPNASQPPMLRSRLHIWVQQLTLYMPALIRLEEAVGLTEKEATMHYLLKGGEGLWEECLVHILKSLKEAQDQPMERLMQTIACRISKKGNNANEVSRCVRALLDTSEIGADYCRRIWESLQNVDAKNEKECEFTSVILEVQIAGWIQDACILESDKKAICCMAALLNLQTYEETVPHDKMALAIQYYEFRQQSISNEADRLEGIQKALKARDPVGTAILLQQLDIQDVSLLDEEIEKLPIDVMGAVVKHGDNQVEISFPLEFAYLQRGAMGIGNASTLFLHLFVDHLSDIPPAFCLHLDTDPGIDDMNIDHTPWVCLKKSKEPVTAFCYGKLTPLVFQLTRDIHRYVRTYGAGIAALHAYIKHGLTQLAHNCMVCGNFQFTEKVQLRRAFPCDDAKCRRIWNNTSLQLQIPEIWSDPFAIDLLLTGVYAAAVSDRTEFLPGCPITTTTTVVAVLNSLPSLANMAKVRDLSVLLRASHPDAEKLLVWACTQYRGVIASATGLCKVPGLPAGTHQFVLANANPELETGFASKLCQTNPTTRVLFHGTSLDRLPSILSQGLKVCSGTPLQRTGAAHGNGIYMAEEPATSFSYSPAAVSWKMSGLHNTRLMFGCEVVGNGNWVSSQIHVIKDPKDVMVRYVFLFTRGAVAPIANHVISPMLSAMTALRSGAM
jgi:hypothetical protein